MLGGWDASATDACLVALSLAMAVATAYFLKLASRAGSPREAAVALFLLAMMAEMLVGGAVYLRTPTTRGLVEAVSVSGATMAASAAPVFLLRPEPLRGTASAVTGRLGRVGFLSLAIGLVLANEALMAWTFALASGAGSIAGGPVGFTVPGVASVLLSPWFVFTMAVEMAVATVLLWSSLDPALKVLLPLQVGIMAMSPPTIAIAGWSTGSVVAGSGAMIALIVYQMEYLYRHRSISRATGAYWLGLLAVYGAMMLGQFLWSNSGSIEVLGFSVAAEMAVYLVAVLSLPAFARASNPVRWLESPRWTLGLLSFVFVAELFMGAGLDRRLAPGQYGPMFAFLPLSGSTATIGSHAVSNGFWFFATAAASTGFLAMMGLEMGALVLFKMRRTRDLENRIRMALMLGCYAAFAVYYPSLLFARAFPHAPPSTSVPVLGWSMGIGSAPLAVGVFGAVLLTYVITGALAVLFGRRVICSTFCTAPLMFQGTTIDAMKSFNRSSPPARHYLSSRWTRVYSGTIALVLASLVATSVLSYLDSTGALRLTILGSDPSVFLFALYFSVLWYVLFVSIPVLGNYNCVTMGWCYTGSIAQAFQKVGFFKLKVRSQEVCRACTTLDCAKGCPVGLVDMPGHFRTRGEFRSSKCCGVGDCVEDCPYGNLYIADVRHWIRRRLGRPEVGSSPRVRLPMAANAAIAVPAPPSALAPPP